MKFSIFFLAIISFSSSLLIGCGSSNDESVKTPWTEKEKGEFAHNCFTSTRFSLAQMKIVATEAQIKEVCDCTANTIEAEYNFDAAKRIPKAKVESILSAALQKCAPELMKHPAADSVIGF